MKVDLITQKATKLLMCKKCIQCGEAGQKGNSCPEWDRTRQHEILSH